jgi:hypothetical protein
MRKTLLLGVLLLTFMNNQLEAQSSERRSTELKDRLWYGLGLTGNYQGGSFSQTFVIGIAPMVGYKVNEKLSFGPRLSTTVSFFKSRIVTGQDQSASPLDWSFGLFGRHRIARDFFAHVEYAFQNEAFIFVDGSGLVIDREVNHAVYVGGGYSTLISDNVGFEMSLNYYTNQPFDDFRNPLNYRFGLNYRF